MRLGGGLIRSRLARRQLLPKDLWNVKGIITSGWTAQYIKKK